MRNDELAKLLNTVPDGTVFASLDIDTGVIDSHGNVIVAKIFGRSVCDAFKNIEGTGIMIHFEESESDDSCGNVVEIIRTDAKKKIDKFNLGSTNSFNAINEFATKKEYTISKAGVKQAGGELLLIKDKRKVIMSFIRLENLYQRVY